MTPDEYLRRVEASNPQETAQGRLCLAYARACYEGRLAPVVPPECRCQKCERPHIPYGPFCGPCEDVARVAYMAAPPGVVSDDGCTHGPLDACHRCRSR